MEKVAEGIDDVWFTELVLDQGHDVGKIRLAGVLAVNYLWGSHGKTVDVQSQRRNRVTRTLVIEG